MNIIINTSIDHIPDGFELIPNQGNYYHHILSCLGYPEERPPVAELLSRYHGLEGRWLVVSPIHWQATHNDAMIIASGDALQLSDEEGRCWFDVFQAWMSLENIRVLYHDANTWLMQCEDKPLLHAKPVHSLHNQSLILELRQLDSTFYWQRLITEGQMLLSEHTLNKERGSLPVINGVWFWGEGALDTKEQGVLIFSDEPSMKLARTLSSEVGLATVACPENSLILLHREIPNELSFYKKQPAKETVQWYWNNLACSRIKKKNWLSRFLSLFGIISSTQKVSPEG